jgi:hypothetical protein
MPGGSASPVAGRSEPSPGCGVPFGGASVPQGASAAWIRRRRGGMQGPRPVPDATFVLEGWIVSVSDDSFVVSGGAVTDRDDDVDVHVPIDLVAGTERQWICAGVRVKWTVMRYRMDAQRMRTDSTLKLCPPSPLSADELRVLSEHAREFEAQLGGFPAAGEAT